MHAARKLALAVLVTALAGAALAQQPGRRPPFPLHADRPGFQRQQGRMNWEERQRLREELNSARREVYKDGGAGALDADARRDAHRAEMQRLREERVRRLGEAQRMSPEERAQLRRDIGEANRDIERR